jgi:hypothetical protein
MSVRIICRKFGSSWWLILVARKYSSWRAAAPWSLWSSVVVGDAADGWRGNAWLLRLRRWRLSFSLSALPGLTRPANAAKDSTLSNYLPRFDPPLLAAHYRSAFLTGDPSENVRRPLRSGLGVSRHPFAGAERWDPDPSGAWPPPPVSRLLLFDWFRPAPPRTVLLFGSTGRFGCRFMEFLELVALSFRRMIGCSSFRVRKNRRFRSPPLEFQRFSVRGSHSRKIGTAGR